MASFTVHIKQSPYAGSGCFDALKFVEAAIAQKHAVDTVFFSGEAVWVAVSPLHVVQDEFNHLAHWCSLSNRYPVPLHLCSAACVRYGVEIGDQAVEQERTVFQVSGLAQLVASMSMTDRVITFG